MVKLFVFETETESIEVNAMDFRDACLTLEEQDPSIKVKDIVSVMEYSCPTVGDTIHWYDKEVCLSGLKERFTKPS